MNTLKIKFGLFTLLAMLAVSMLITSCQQEELIDTEVLEIEQQQSTTDQDPFMTELINSTSSEKIKQWLTTDFTKETDPEAALKLFTSFSIEESKEVNEIITKLESHVFENQIAEHFNLSESDRIIARQENAEAAQARQTLNELAQGEFGKTMWSLNEAEVQALVFVEAGELESRGSCSSRKRSFGLRSSMTTLRSYTSNCKGSYDVKACSSYYGNYYNCASDCDWEFRFDGKKLKHRIVTNGNISLAAVIDVGLRVKHGTRLGARYQYWGGRWHTYLQIGYPDPLEEYVLTRTGVTVGRWTVRYHLSMH